MNDVPVPANDTTAGELAHRIELRPGRPWGAWFFAVAGLLLLAQSASTSNPHWAIAAAGPLLVGFALWYARPKSFAATLTETGFEISEPSRLIRYEDMEGLRACGLRSAPRRQMRGDFPIAIFHRDGIVTIPAHLNVPSARLYFALCNLLSPRGGRDVTPQLLDYRQREETACGSDAVFCYHVRSWRCKAPGSWRGRAVSLALVGTSIIWGVVGGMVLAASGKEPFPWTLPALLLFISSVVSFVVCWLSGRVRKRKSKGRQWSSLVISPRGLALAQGDLRGQLSWDEVLDVKLTSPSWSIFYHERRAGRGIALRVEGATITILDMYDRPLPVIHRVIRRYWNDSLSKRESEDANRDR